MGQNRHENGNTEKYKDETQTQTVIVCYTLFVGAFYFNFEKIKTKNDKNVNRSSLTD